MAFRMGFNDTKIISEIPIQDLATVLSAVPAKPIVTNEEWELITNYYFRKAPEAISLPEQSVEDTIRQFSVTPLRFSKPMITLVKFDSLRQQILVGTRTSQLFVVDKRLTVTDSIATGSPPSNIYIEKDAYTLSAMGIMDPNDQAIGKLVSLSADMRESVNVIDSLQRPVYFDKHDLNADGKDDLVICAFGHYTGALLIYEGTENNSFIKRTLNTSPGARKVVIHDFNADGLPDILALMSQGDERLVLYINEGRMNFEEKVLVRFPPVYGSNYFELADFNSDGHPDILMSNGDNGDFSVILKPYHGVRILENDGNNNFTERWFYPMPGACQATARDFDNDGDLDIAAISYFPDFDKHPERSFIYFENAGNNVFKPQTTPLASSGRWIVMEPADYDADGDLDIILGSLTFRGLGATRVIYQHWMETGTPLIILENKTYHTASHSSLTLNPSPKERDLVELNDN